LFEFLERYEPTNVGVELSYSNLGFAALAEACAIVEGRDHFRDLVKDEILGKDT